MTERAHISEAVRDMKAAQHPDYSREQEYLELCRKGSEEALEHLGTSRPSSAAYVYRNARAALQKMNETRAQELQRSKDDPFKGRVDFVRHGDDGHSQLYFGLGPISLGGRRLVYDWRAPIGSIFLGKGFKGLAYTTPDGREIKGDALLRRDFRIIAGQLVEIHDRRPEEYASTSNAKAKGVVTVSDFLRGVLAESRDPLLREFVGTVQAEQVRLIQHPLDCILMVQGVPGSGKSSIALHRLSYFIYEDEQVKARLDASRVLIISPTRAFVDATADLLPTLRVWYANPVTFDEWVRTWMKSELLTRRENPWLDPDQHVDVRNSSTATTARLQYVAAHQRARLQGSLQMRELLRAYLHLSKINLQRIQRALSGTYELPHDNAQHVFGYMQPGESVSLSLDSNSIRQLILDSSISLPAFEVRLNAQRDRLISLLVSRLWQQVRESEKYPRFATGERSQARRNEEQRREQARADHFRRFARNLIGQFLSDFWQALEADTCYRRLISDREVLQAAASEMARPLDARDIEILYTPAARRSNYAWGSSELACIAYLHILLNGAGDREYDHIVVDEAQDLSPLQFDILRLHARKPSMTLVGDINQSVDLQGINEWKELTGDVEANTVRYDHLPISYRSTYEIMYY